MVRVVDHATARMLASIISVSANLIAMANNAAPMAAAEAAEVVVARASAVTTNASVSLIATVNNVGQTVAVEAAADVVVRMPA